MSMMDIADIPPVGPSQHHPVGQQVIGGVSDTPAIETYNDAEAVLHEAQQIQAHLAAQDAAIEALARHLKLELPELPSVSS